MSDNTPTPREIAEDWYDEEVIVSWVRIDCMGRPVPVDVRSREFGVWLCNEFRLAMAKGIELERNRTGVKTR